METEKRRKNEARTKCILFSQKNSRIERVIYTKRILTILLLAVNESSVTIHAHDEQKVEWKLKRRSKYKGIDDQREYVNSGLEQRNKKQITMHWLSHINRCSNDFLPAAVSEDFYNENVSRSYRCGYVCMYVLRC